VRALIAAVSKKGEDATGTAVTMLSALSSPSTRAFSIASPSRMETERAIDAMRRLRLNSHVIIGREFSINLRSDSPQLVTLKNATMVFEGRTYPPKEIFKIKSFALDWHEHGEETAKSFIRKSSGDYAFVLAEPTRLIAGRDAVGLSPLYYGENARFAALASERKALWKIGIHKSHSFPPGHIASIDDKGFRLEPVKTLSHSEPTPITMQDAARKLETLLHRSVRQRVSTLEEVAVAFSGGLDSSIIAIFAKKHSNVQLIHVGLEGQKETEHAKKAAEILKLPIHIRLFNEEDVKEDLQKVLWLIEEANPVKTGIGIPIYWAAEQAKKIGFKVMLAGQGADELFGGYRRYVDDYSLLGEEEVRKRLFKDVAELYENNLERDSKICSSHGIELRLPFATFEMERFAAALPVNLKIDPQDSRRKLVLRKVAENVGLPESISQKSKKAVQYTTGVDKALKRLAKRQGVSVKAFLQKIFMKILEEAV
jgi:asparagine synthase (glutamine-hydrolysing)